MLERSTIDLARRRYEGFLDSLSDDQLFKLTSSSEVTPYARCFAIFGCHLLQCKDRLLTNADLLAASIRNDLDQVRESRRVAGACLNVDKPYLQLLTFSLSALLLLNRLENDPLEDHVLPLLSKDIDADLRIVGAVNGVPRSGNQAMFMAILLCHAQSYLDMDVQNSIDNWERVHLKSINQFGFWGPYKSMSHLQFQNGYHQYEAMDYLNTKSVPWENAADNVAALADRNGHFAPYPGGGGCYDYDAVYILTSAGAATVNKYKELLLITANSILCEQNIDGGFCETHRVRPRSIHNALLSAKHVYNASGIARVERLRQMITLLRPKHDRIHTHWSTYSRRWNESDLWDSWFRMLTVARIDVALDASRVSEWGFIDYPGIGFHSALRSKEII